jgi:site-specific recombinase XerD
MFATWCTSNRLQILELKRAHIEIFGREMEAAGRMRPTVARRLSTVAGLFKYCHDEGLLDRNPAANVRRPKVDHESRTLGLDRNELGRHSFITAALDAGVPLRDAQEAASHADPRTTMRYDRARQSLDRHATYIVSAFVAGAARG